jgi:hypothetical protein
MIGIVMVKLTLRQDLRNYSYLAYHLSESIVATFLAVYTEIKLLNNSLIKSQH